MNIGRAIRAIRKEMDISQNRLAEMSNITQTSLSQIENGIKRPSAKSMLKICEALEVPEMLIYIMAMQEEDVPESKRHIYRIIYPSILSLSLQMIGPAHVRIVQKDLK